MHRAEGLAGFSNSEPSNGDNLHEYNPFSSNRLHNRIWLPLPTAAPGPASRFQFACVNFVGGRGPAVLNHSREQIDHNLPRLIVLDLMMPRMNGWEVLEELRSREILGRVPVLVLSAVATQRADSLSEYGVQGVLEKPFEVGELMRMLRKILDETN